MSNFNKQFYRGGNQASYLKKFKEKLIKIYDKKLRVEKLIMKNDAVLMRDYVFNGGDV